ncbi:uncharacterized protein LOC101895946 isoform X1 [Musca domestica]|uniref:Uncharacterized protein LOC101895946 isoform X1 n=1 Tax=Musca domestica TaxID=7370 RepID=A0A9J7DCB9_MUSDO|nr:uncharacterized protein LOC101895946 isoform X1 [Musca domestica]
MHELSAGVLPRMKSGEYIDSPVLQLLTSKSHASGPDKRICLLLSDGVYFDKDVKLTADLNNIYDVGKLSNFSVLRVDEYKIADKNMLIICKMTILTPGQETNGKIGEPIDCNNALTLIASTNVEPDHTAALTSGALLSMMSGKNITRPVLQILDSKLICDGRDERIRLSVSDGRFFHTYTWLSSTLKNMYHEGILSDFCIVSLDEYLITSAGTITNRRRIFFIYRETLIILKMSLLVPGDQVKVKIGEPVVLEPSVTTRVISTIPTLTTGALPRMKSGEYLDSPVLQLLTSKSYGSGPDKRIRLFLSDGAYFDKDAKLATDLINIYDVGKLSNFSILRVDEYKIADKNMLIICKMTILTPGQGINERIGEPIDCNNALALIALTNVEPHHTALTSGALLSMMSGKNITRPVLQILGSKLILNGRDERIRLLVSDGKFYQSYTLLSSTLKNMYHEGILSDFCIVRLDEYFVSRVATTPKRQDVLIILEMKLLVPGDQVKVKIGEPVVLEPSITTNVKSTIRTLTTGAIADIRAGIKKNDPVLKIVGAKVRKIGDIEQICLEVSDGKYFESNVLVSIGLNYLFYAGKLSKNTIIKLDEYMYHTNYQSPTFLILKMTILAAGDKVKKPVRTAMHYIEDLTKETTPMTNLPQLCTGYLPIIMCGLNSNIYPVIQILKAEIVICAGAERIRLLISDGKFTNSNTLLSEDLNFIYHEGKLSNNAIVKVNKYLMIALNHDRKQTGILIQEMTVLTPGQRVSKIGNPIDYRRANEGNETERSASDPRQRNIFRSLRNLKFYNLPSVLPKTRRNKPKTVIKYKYQIKKNLKATVDGGLTYALGGLRPNEDKWTLILLLLYMYSHQRQLLIVKSTYN